ncbi:hypothetical protein [Actinokineospora globicatena]|uniref:Uncharacterized protein n=1 Tax=Actinokineospora globicatena TaxID=103729 RepID=A0A9W6QT69_9PSEU|nr:hypothetical protein [Actinokineospora globicatena]MCP2301691.1 hypothetical protein [Actinokineospora globicatena]GLW76653.1 hypothetical protein Aglo01_11350 [Actinokineospora globicatena]GLW83487.1 hypothetical protein Aglo02_11270 [Actinokineospora globicatena]GLW95681.1 hypothetical protein Aglo03_64970 [Actinokineospora globicatena]
MTTSGPGPQDNEPTPQPLPAAPPVQIPLPHQEWPTERPKAVRTAFTLLLVQAGLNLLAVVLVLAIGRKGFEKVIRDGLVESGQAATAEAVQLGATTAFAFALVLALIPVIAYGALSFPVRNGHNWARLTVSIFAVVHAVLLLLGLLTGGGGAVLSVLQIVLLGITVARLYGKEAKPYFDKQRLAS